MSGTPLVKVCYINMSGSPIPPHGVFQLSGAPTTTATGDIVMQAVAAGRGNGPYMIDDGKGTASSGAGQYGTCCRGGEGLVWVAYGCDDPANLTPWCDVGPINGDFIVNTSGYGYWYAGVYQSNGSVGSSGDPIGRILVMIHTYCIQATDCGSGSSGSGSSSSGANNQVVTDVTCSGGSLVVTKSRFKWTC